MNYVTLLVVTCLLVHAPASGQTPAELRAQLDGQTGPARARTLAALTDALRQDQPAQALAYGAEALALFARHPAPEWEVRTLNEMAWAHMTLSDYTNAVGFAQRGLKLAERHHDRAGRARAVNNLGVIAQRRDDALQAVAFFTDALNAYRELGRDLEVSTALSNLGFVHSTALANYEVALSYHLEALAVRERLADRAAVALSLNNIGIVYHRLGDLGLALSHYERSLAIRRQVGGDNRIAATLHNIGDLQMDKGDFPQALHTHREALELRRRIGDRTGTAHSLRNIGVVYHKLGHEADARRYLVEGLDMAAAVGDRRMIAEAHLGLAELDRERGPAHRAISHARDALTIAQSLQNLELTRRALEQLAASQERALDYAGALASFRRFHEITTRIFDNERGRRIEHLDRRYLAEHRDAELARLRAEQAQAALQLSQQAVVRNALLAAAAVLALGAFGLYRHRVDSARLAERLSVTDTLTGLKNRRYVLQTIEADVSAAARRYRRADEHSAPGNADLVFMLIDIDNFKAINDRHGHAAGDLVLTQIADVIRATCRAADTIARWGGEEFLVILRFSDRVVAPLSAERIRMAIQEHLFAIGGGRTIAVTCSIGFASFPFFVTRPDEVTWEEVIAHADGALYRAKQRGRNTWEGPDRPAAVDLPWLDGHVQLDA